MYVAITCVCVRVCEKTLKRQRDMQQILSDSLVRLLDISRSRYNDRECTTTMQVQAMSGVRLVYAIACAHAHA